MAWKKLVVSGSNISQLNNDESYLKQNGTGAQLSGSFSGSFQGDGSGLTGVTAGASNALTDGNGIVDFSYDGTSAGVTVAVEADGSTLSVGASGVKVADGGITATQIATSVAGDGLAGGGGTALSVGVDDSTVEINSDALRVKDLGIATGKIANDAVTTAKIAHSLGTMGTHNFTGSFSGSFIGTTDLPDLTDGNGIADFTYDGSSTATVALDLDGSTLTVGASGVKISDGGVDTTQLADEAVNTAKISGSSITTAKIIDAQVTNAKLANSSVTIGSTAVALGATVTTFTGIGQLTATGVTASLFGTASHALSAVTASQVAGTASFADRATTASFADLAGTIRSGLTASHADRATSASLADVATSARGVVADSVALGTDTTGNYVATLGSGTGVTIGSNTGEGSSPTIAVNYGSSANNAVEGDTNITINGTSNEVSITGTAAQALGGGPTYTIGLPDDVTIGRDLVVSRNLTVAGTASFQHTTDLDVADRFIRLASGSNAAGDGGIVVQQGSNGRGQVFGYDNGSGASGRWGVTSSFDPATNTISPDAFMSLAIEGGDNVPGNAPSTYQEKGNIFIGNTGDIWIYSS